jgi:LacI family transcriptional regulator
MSDVAQKLGISRPAVSIALRGGHGVSEDLRRQVRKAAKEMGYVPDPFLSGLAAHTRGRLPVKEHGVLAWINHWEDPKQLRRYGEFDGYWRGASLAAKQYGYRVDEICWESGCPPKRLERILLARGIEGVLIPPHRALLEWKDFDWGKFSVVRFGLAVPSPDSNLVTADVFRATVMAITRLHEYGYRRIGVITNREYNRRTGGNLVSGCFCAQDLLKLETALPPLMTFLETRTAEEVSRQKAVLQDWLERHQPDAVLISERDELGMIRDLGYKLPGDLAVAGTTVLDLPGVDAGIDQHSETIGRIAVEMLVKQINVSERGEPRYPCRILVESRWRDGKSVPGKSKPDQAGRIQPPMNTSKHR